MNVPAAKPRDLGIWMTAAIWSLLFARWFVPAEATSEGSTLWLAALTALVGAAWAWWQTREESGQLVVDVWDRAVWWLVIAHVAAGCAVLVTLGNKRASLNMIWEWTSIGLQFLLLRQTLTSLRRRVTFLQAALVLWVAIAAFGIWQQFVLYPGNVQDYARLRNEMTTLQADRTHDLAQMKRNRDRIAEIVNEFLAQRIPLEGPQVGLFERRLESKEPIGFFVLANSLGGMLGTALLLGSGALIASSHQRRRAAVIATGLLVVAGCLLLTKSRTAWCGTAAGGAVLAWWVLRKRSAISNRFLIAGGAVLLAAVLLVPLAAMLGGLDAEVLSEAPKSLAYRLQYWTGTLDIVREHPWLGVGPGNFRWHYLQHKLPQASEEISDPHNFVLDVAANAGLLGVVGLLAVLGAFLWTVVRLNRADFVSQEATGNATQVAEYQGARAIGLSVLLVAAWQAVFEGQAAADLLTVGGAAVLLAFLCERFLLGDLFRERETVLVASCVAATVGLLVHLLGAGGFASPAILNWLLALVAVLSMSGRDAEIVRQKPLVFFRVAAVSYLVLAVLIAQFGWMPSVTTQGLVLAGDQDFGGSGQVTAAAAKYERAREIDPLSATPWLGISRVAFAKWIAYDRDEHFEDGVAATLKAFERDPFNSKIAQELSTWWLQRYKKSSRPEHIQNAVEWAERAVAMYPTNPGWNADLANAYKLAGKTAEARSQAEKALALDEINHKAGHIDRYLPDAVAAEMRSLAAP